MPQKPARPPALFPCSVLIGYAHPYVKRTVRQHGWIPEEADAYEERWERDTSLEQFFVYYVSEAPPRAKMQRLWTHVTQRWPTTDDESEKARRLEHMHQEAWELHRNKYTMRHLFADFPSRLLHALERGAIHTPEALFALSAKELRAMCEIGHVGRRLIEQARVTYQARVSQDASHLWDAWAARWPACQKGVFDV